MHSTINNSTTKHLVYKAHEAETLMSEVSRVICVLMPHAFLAAGLNASNNIRIAQYYAYDKTLQPWQNEFFEHTLRNEPLLGDLSILPKVFIASGKQVIIPEELYHEADAVAWLRNVFFIEADETIHHYKLSKDRAQMTFAVTAIAENLAKTYFNHATIRPSNACQYSSTTEGNSLDLLLMDEAVWATFRQKGKLIWHQYFSYNNAEEIAHRIAMVCKEHNVNHTDVDMQGAAVSPELTGILETLQSFFPKLKYDNADVAAGQESWAPVIYFVQQLNACVS